MAIARLGLRSRLLLGTLGLALVAGLAAMTLDRWLAPGELQAGLESGWARLEQAPPWIFFPVMALICLLPFPIVLFYVSAGPLFGVGPALLWIAPTLVVNQWLGHALAAGVLRPRIERWIEGHGYTVPRVTRKSDQTLFTMVVRITPGFPYFLQNLILGVAGIERRRYLLISFGVQMVYATGFVLLGRSAFEGEFGVALGAGAALVGISLLARRIHRRLRATTPGPNEADTPEIGSAPS
jgi:uncharacterized membrane protein YdjX (TVP38/TMEM64 family)